MVGRLRSIIPTVDQTSILDHCHGQGTLSGGFAFMTIMSLGLATLGLLLNSPSVIIGAMLVSPLMGPIIAVGFAFPALNLPLLLKGGTTLLIGVLISVLTATALVSLSPIDDLTSEILARTRPNLFDLLVALFSGLVGGYAIINANMTAIVGVAIATALMPPLATVGFGIATHQTWVAHGAAMLFVTNISAITLGVSLVAIWYGFGRAMSGRGLLWQGMITVLIGMSLLTPLLNSLRGIAEEMAVKRTVRTVLEAQVEKDLSNMMGEYRVNLLADGSVQVMGIAYVDKPGNELETLVAQNLEVSLGRKVKVLLKQIPVHDLETLKEKQSPPPAIRLPSAVANPIQSVTKPVEMIPMLDPLEPAVPASGGESLPD
ncbi:MAG: DUF389 domain-containing protein [Magnetococcales bacterium]|nr:DUF389 domain-containing protein [Magnetococcales bacterium]